MTRSLPLLCSVLALSLVAAGCGSSNKSGGGDDAATQTQMQTQAGGGAAKGGAKKGKIVQVAAKNVQFSPKAVTVAKGTAVKWTNKDSLPHDVTKVSGPGPKFASGQGNMQQGDTYQQTFTTPGTIMYRCTVHPGMVGTVTVK